MDGFYGFVHIYCTVKQVLVSFCFYSMFFNNMILTNQQTPQKYCDKFSAHVYIYM